MTATSLTAMTPRLKKRKAAEKRFQFYGKLAIAIGLAMLIYLVWTIVTSGYNGFLQTRVTIPMVVSEAEFTKAEKGVLKTSNYKKLLGAKLRAEMEVQGIETDLSDKNLRNILSSRAASDLRELLRNDPSLLGQEITLKVLAQSRVDGYMKGRVFRENIAKDKRISVEQLDTVDMLRDAGMLKKSFNTEFFTGTDAAEQSPEAAGFGPAILGSLAMIIIVAVGSISLGVAASIYLEEFAPKNRLTDLIEVNISNLAAVPSIVFGILGLAVFINYLGPISSNDWFKNNSAFVGGMVLTLMTLPTVIIASRAALKAVPPSIRDAALGVGASKMQMVFHHVLPLAAPGILTGSIIGLAQALGESAPLLLVGLVIAQGGKIPENIGEFFGGPNTAMPAQIYQWSTRADPAFYERAWAGIIVLLVFLMAMNLVAILLRRRFERRW